VKKISIETILPGIEKPSRYLGMEVNSVHKPDEEVIARAVLAFPDLYEVGMSHLGTQILYGLGNQVKGVQVERVFLPEKDMLSQLAEKSLPLFTLESRTSLADCSLVGFTLQSELTYTNLLAMLEAGGIPLRSADREDGHPVILAGGPCAFNPEPLAPFVDLFLLGDGEEQWVELLKLVRDMKAKGAARKDVINAVSEKIPGIYNPSLFPEGASAGEVVARAPVVGLEREIPVGSFLVPFMQTVHDRINVEVTRGCTRGCRFCAAGMVYRPVRERSAQSVFDLARQALAATGYEDLSLNSLSVGDYGPLDEVLSGLMDCYEGDKISLSLPSMRVGSLTPEVARQIQRVRKTGFTIAPEAGTERLRKVVNKEFSDNEIKETAGWVFSQGWDAVKLYFMIGLPTETDEDLEGLAALARELSTLAPSRGKVTVNLSPFVPKPHTPFQWSAQDSEEELKRKLSFLRESLRLKKVQVRWGRTDQAILEAVLARGDRKVGDAIEAAYLLGAIRDGWEEHFSWDTWQAAFENTGVDPDWYAGREWSTDEPLPWDHISCGVSKEFLLREYKKAVAGEVTPDCREAGCRACGTCSPEEAAEIPPLREAAADVEMTEVGKQQTAEPEKTVRRIRCLFSKVGDTRFLGHLETMRAFERAARRGGVPLAFTGGFHPKPKITFALSLPMGVEGQGEMVDFELGGSVSPQRFAEVMNRSLPAGLRVDRAWKAPLEGQALNSRVAGLTYTAALPGSVTDLEERVSAVLAAGSVSIERERKGKKRTLELKDYLQEMETEGDSTLSFGLRFKGEQGSVRPQEVLEAVLGEAMPPVQEVTITRTALQLRIEKDKSGGRPGWSRVWD
jgi:radical SAM family uncharacterized protein/radical SAM-linked protein